MRGSVAYYILILAQYCNVNSLEHLASQKLLSWLSIGRYRLRLDEVAVFASCASALLRMAYHRIRLSTIQAA